MSIGCENCKFCQVSLIGRKMWKCKLYPNKRFDYPKLHGIFCQDKVEEITPDEKEKELLKNR